MNTWLELRPGRRIWQGLTAADPAADSEALVQYALETSAPIRQLPEAESFLDPLSAWLGPDEWCIFFDATRQSGEGSWFRWLRERLGWKLFRLTADSVADIDTYLDQHPQIRMVFAQHLAPDTGEALDLEELFFSVKAYNPGILCVADVSHSLGLLPFYMDHFDADAAIIRREGLGHYLAARPELMPPGLMSDEATDTFLPYLQAARARGLPALWNAAHLEAKALRTHLQSLGASLTIQHPSDAMTGFSLPGIDCAEAQQLLATKGIRVGLGERLSRESHLIVQHAPDPAGTLAPLHDALTALRAD